MAEHGSTAEGRRAAMTHFMSFALENPELFYLLFEHPLPGFEPSEEGMREERKLVAFSDGIVEQQRAAREIDESIPLDQSAICLWPSCMASRHCIWPSSPIYR